MMRQTLSLALILLNILIHANASGLYTIVAPGTLQSEYNYTVIVTLHKNSEPAKIKVGIEGPSVNKTKTLKLAPAQTEILHFELPVLKNGDYILNAEGIEGLIFQNSTKLNFKSKDPKIYIQTDKASYKPGDLVQYRIIVLDEETRPAELGKPLKLVLKDGSGNIVKQINEIELFRGVYSGEFQLSEQPVLGNWIIETVLGLHDDGTKTEKNFEVAKYVLPKFSIEIETAKAISYDDPLQITVRAKYTYGKPVKGKATIKTESPYGQSFSEKVIEVDGKGYVEFNLARDLKITRPTERRYYSYHDQSITIFAIMTEEYTGIKQNRTVDVKVRKSSFVIEVPKSVHVYTAKQPFQYKAFVKHLDGSPVRNSKHLAKLQINKANNGNFNSNSDFVFTSEVDENGMALFEVTLPTAETYYYLKITFDNADKQLPNLVGHTDENHKVKYEERVGPLELVLKTKTPQLNEDVVIEVKSNEHIPFFIYSITARGNIIKQEHVKLPENVKSHEIIIKPSFKMVPYARLYVYFVRKNELLFKELTLNFPVELLNKIEITAPEQAKPSEEVTLNIKTDPESFVGLLGVDQSVLLLKSGNDFDASKILNDLRSYDTSTPDQRGSGVYPGQTSGLVTLTNANYPYSAYRELMFYNTQFSLRGPAINRNIFAYPSMSSFQGQIFGGAAPAPNSFIPQKPQPQPQIRKEFVENWIFDNLNNTGTDGLATFTKKIPDTITSWVITGFSMNEKTGFGMTANPTNIKVFQPFFISTNLPYSVKRGEVISIPIIVFNYMDKTLDAEVTMENTDEEYDFTEVSNEIEELVLEDKQRIKRVSVPANSGKPISFMIRPNKVGDITLKLKAITPLAGDAIHQKLKVEPEGVTQYENEAIFISPSSNKEITKEVIKAVIPKEAVLDSEFLEFSVVGDILGPTIKNIDNLVRMPYGCGEQNMVNFVPNILVLHYLDAIKQKQPKVVEKAIKFMEVGYQRQLTYKHTNGAYSAFGEKRSEANSWLTAYVARSFIQAQKYITIDQTVIDDALKYLLSNQLRSGRFEQTGRLFHPSHQNDVGFTAFSLLALLEDTDLSKKYKYEIRKSVKYLTDNIDNENDTYALAIALAVLQKVQHHSSGKLKEKLDKLAKEENGLKWWTKSSMDQSNDIEITAYILEAYVYSEPAAQLLPIMKWLVSNRNSMGGFDSTQDTVVGLQALIRFAEKHIHAGDNKTIIEYQAQDDEGKETTKGSFEIDKKNSWVMQTHVLPKSTRQVTFETNGEGSSLVQFSYRYNLANKDKKPSFNVKHTILKGSHPNNLKINICADYVPGADSEIKESNMAIMEIYLPSGFTADLDQLQSIQQVNQVQRTDTKNSDTAIIIYFDYLAAGEKVCLEANAEKTHAVAKQKPAAIVIYDYYKSDHRATLYYEIKSSLCDICEADDCGKGCPKK